MPKIVTGLFMSLDGIVDADDNWQFAYFDDEFLEGITAGMAQASAALMGRRSYQGYNALRAEHPESPMVAFLDKTPKYVASTTLKDASWPNTTVLGSHVGEQIAQLKRQPGNDIVVLGSPTLVGWLLRNDLLDELSIRVLPIIVGSGTRLFQDMILPAGHINLNLNQAQTLTSGVLDLKYTPTNT